jgi:hypothetical protein
MRHLQKLKPEVHARGRRASHAAGPTATANRPPCAGADGPWAASGGGRARHDGGGQCNGVSALRALHCGRCVASGGRAVAAHVKLRLLIILSEQRLGPTMLPRLPWH